MRISIALCTYNGARYLSDQLASIAQQRRLPDELIICDDCSSDSTPQIVSAFAQEAPFPVRFRQNAHNLGSTPNFEQAIRAAQGDVIALCDQDDFWYPHKLAAVESAFASSARIGFVFSNADVVDLQRQQRGYTLWQSVRFNPREQEQVSTGQALSVLLRHPVVTGTTMAFRASFRDLILPIPPQWIHDEWIAFLIAIRAGVGVIQQPLLEYRVHTGNQVGAESTNLWDRLRVGLSTDTAVYLKRSQQYGLLYERVAQRLPAEHEVLALLEAKREHLRVRGTLPRQRLWRVAPILRELRNGGYRRYSASTLNAVRDLVLAH